MMLRVALLGLVASALVTALNIQVPLESGHSWRDDSILYGEDSTGWTLDKLPNPNSTDHLVFETVHSLLQPWPNTRMRTGHNIVPGIIPKGTLLYHGTDHAEPPLGSEWVAMDPEHAYYFCQHGPVRADSEFQGEDACWFLTLTTTRHLKIVYLDGNSAAKLMDGSLDAQDLLVWGKSRPDRVWDESRRIRDLCEWVTKFDVDGIVRMGMDFEVMLCDFTSGVRRISFENLEPPEGNAWLLTTSVVFEAVNAASRHNHFPGETRIQLDLARLVSFYDTQLVPSLVAFRAGQQRWDHRLQDISNGDLAAVKSRVEALLTSPWGSSSGTDWKTLIHVIVDRFAGRLELTRHLLNSPVTSPKEMIDLVNKTHTQLRIILTPYLLLSARPTIPSDKTDLDWTRPIHTLCAITHTDFVASELDSITDSERLILQAVRGTSREICRVVVKMWAAGVYLGIDPSVNTKESFDIAEAARLRGGWGEDLNRLMAWLDWSVWVKCDPECGPMELCYLPTWPIGFPGFPPPMEPSGPLDLEGRPERLSGSEAQTMSARSLARQIMNTVEPRPDEWIRPQPKCVSRVAPYEY